MKIIYKNKENINPTKITTSSRGIVIKDNLVLLTYSNYFEDYITPGGRILLNETLEETLARELKDEVGIYNITFEEIGVIFEYYFKKGKYELKKHHYYLIKNYQEGVSNKCSDEINYGMESRWINPDDAIKENNKQIKKRIEKGLNEEDEFVTSLKRENEILKYIKENYL
ncbi:MAG: NUDIX domain-containing protein [Acholeplasmatales bacterium]